MNLELPPSGTQVRSTSHGVLPYSVRYVVLLSISMLILSGEYILYLGTELSI